VNVWTVLSSTSEASYWYPISWETFFDPSDSYFLFAEERGYHKWALAHSSSYSSSMKTYIFFKHYIMLWLKWTTYFFHTICSFTETKYQISAINSCWEKCDEKCAYMFNVYTNQLSRQTGSRNLTGPKTLPTIWHTYMKLVTKYQIPVINSCWEKYESVFWPVRFLLPVCRLSWFLYTLNIYAHFSSHFSHQLLMAEIWYLVTSFIYSLVLHT
jgi:hypothetical protein